LFLKLSFYVARAARLIEIKPKYQFGLLR